MATFDPDSIRKAVSEFSPRQQQRFEQLLPAKDVIVELRQKRASYRSIAELLTQHCLPTGKTAIADFCHEVLGEAVRPRRRLVRKRTHVSETRDKLSERLLAPAEIPPAETISTKSVVERPSGPRVAQIRKLVPQNHETTDSHH
jgi:hypothetical protein